MSRRLVGRGALRDCGCALGLAASGWDVATTYWRPYDTTMAWGSDQMAAVASQVPLGRVSRPEDCANLVTFLCSERGGWINGQLLHSNGGIQ